MSLDDDDPVDLDFPIVRLRALYDYSYKDDDGHMVTMKQGDEYHLISKSGDWWEVIRDAGGANEFTFYVPASYVKIIDEDNEKNSPRSNITKESNSDNNNEKYDQDDILVTGSENVKTDMAHTARSTTNYIDQNEVGITFGKGKSCKKKSESSIPSATVAVTAVKAPYRRSYSDDGDYVNLDKYRTDADIEVNDGGESTDSDYANLAAIQQSKLDLPSPDIEKCDFIRTLLDVWDMFHDPETNRLFYINKDTNERTWKPPRHPNKHERAQQIIANAQGPFLPRYRVAKLDTKFTGGILPEIKVGQSLTNIPEGWTVEETKEGTVYLNENNEDRWMSSINAEGIRYFYKVGSTETAWDLPKTNRKSNGDVAMELPSPQTSPTAPRSRSPQNCRSMKAKSMFIESNLNFQHPPHLPTSPPPRAQTLPNNLNTQAGGETNVEKAIFTPQQEPFAGTVSRAKMYEANKKLKKNWVNCYCKLSGSNIVFYKDMKSSKSVPGSPFGKADLIIPLQGCIVCKATKEMSSKRNVFALSTSHRDQYLVQVDDDKSAQKLYIQLEIKINELQGEVLPSLSSVRSAEINIEKPSTNSIANRLNKFFNIRSTKDSLEERGILKYSVIGGDLKMICDKENNKIPKFVQKCVAAIESRGLDHDGIYRINGNQAHIQKLRCQVDQDTYDLDSKEWDVFTLTGTLKQFFRELKEPLLTFQLFEKLVPALMKASNAERLKIFRENVHNLPKCNFETFKFLCTHLLKVSDLCKENRMEVQNIAIVFGPTLIWPPHETNQAIATNMVFESKIVEYCLLESKAIFR